MVRLAWLGSGGRGWEACLLGHTGPGAPGSPVCGFMDGALSQEAGTLGVAGPSHLTFLCSLKLSPPLCLRLSPQLYKGLRTPRCPHTGLCEDPGRRGG